MTSFFSKFSKAIWNIKDKIFKSEHKIDENPATRKQYKRKEKQSYKDKCLIIDLNRADKNSDKKYATTKGFSIPRKYDSLVKNNVADSSEKNIAKHYLRLKNKFIESQKNKLKPKKFMSFKKWQDTRFDSIRKAV